ncbi:MAG: SDR family oxidoreductase [Verrucomicrobiota bacterium]|nr:SDR family oxidoreductase [Verrucomicrobiota bacterium]
MSGFDLAGCCALITGASAGIGREFARQLAGRAGSLVLVARRLDRLEALRAELTRRDPNLKVLCRAVDLSRSNETEELCLWLEREKIVVDFLINNAGLGDRGSFATSDPQRVREMLTVNIVALTTLTRALLPAMIQRKRGAILNVSSIAGFLPIRNLAVYAATKAYVTSFSEGIRAEVRKMGITVSALCPGPVATEFSEVAQRGSGKEQRSSPSFMHVPVEDVVHAGLEAVERNKPIVVPGLVMKIAMLLVRLTPMAILRRV